MGFWFNTQPACENLAEVGSKMICRSKRGGIDWPRTLQAARIACEGGVRHAIVTEHSADAALARNHGSQLQSLLDQHNLALQIRCAVEVSLTRDLFDRVIDAATLFAGLNRRFVFLRVPTLSTLSIAPVVEILKRMGLQTILLSPEKSITLRRRKSEWQRLEKADAIIQMSTSSLIHNPNDPDCLRFSRKLIRNNQCDLLASDPVPQPDAQNDNAKAVGWPCVSMNQAYQLVHHWAGKSVADRICRVNPKSLFDDLPIDTKRCTTNRISLLFSRAG
tara:strand:- start:306 stop:1133 length:828 start_codon:yes stop_codon:yes gene_type:complete